MKTKKNIYTNCKIQNNAICYLKGAFINKPCKLQLIAVPPDIL